MSANAFMSGFTGGMTSMNSMMDSAEQRRTRREDRDNQQALQYFSAINHGYQGMNDEQKQEFQASVVDRMNGDPAIQQILSRNVGHNEQKRISPQFGKMTKDGFVPVIDVVDGRTGEVIRTGPLTEFGNSDGSDKPVAIGNEDFMTMMGSYLGKDDFGRQMELEIISRGGQLPEKAEQFNQEWIAGTLYNRSSKDNKLTSTGGGKNSGSGSGGGMDNPNDWGKPDTTHSHEGRRMETYHLGDGRVMARIFDDPENFSKFEVHDITHRYNESTAGGGSVDDQFARSFLADTNTNPTDEGAGGGGEPEPKPKPGGMEEVKKEPDKDAKRHWLIDSFSNAFGRESKKNANRQARIEETNRKRKEVREKYSPVNAGGD